MIEEPKKGYYQRITEGNKVYYIIYNAEGDHVAETVSCKEVSYKYGMRSRPAGVGCQPKGFADILEAEDDKYWNILVYNRELTKKEQSDYELDFLGIE